MKTRLLALVLACLMVLSVMPVVVFAEDFCELSSQVDGDHTLATCPDGEYIKTVPPQCGDRWGYDLFKCPGCSEFFADNFVAPIKDAHALELVEKGTAATCKTEGVSAKYECMNMHVDANGNPIKCDYTKGGEVLPKLEHDWQRTGSETGDCESDALISFKCSLCGETKTEGSKNEHSWITPPTIEMESQLDANGNLVAIGWGTYTCSRCPATKKVIVLHDCTLVKVPAKDATCVADGNNEYWQCTNSDCGKRFATNDATGTVLTDENIVIPVGTNGGHDLKKVDAKAATCNKDQTVNPGNIEYYDCKLCGRNFADANATTELPDEQVIDDDHAWRKDASGNNEDGWVPPTCTEWGGYRYICGRCGAIKNNAPVEPLGHTGYDEKDEAGNYVSTNRKEIWTSCQEGGERTWDCGRCGEAQKEAVAKHGLKTATFPATCTRVEYSFQYCDICAAPATQPTSKTHTDGLVYDLTVNGVAYMIVGEVTFGTETNPANHNWVETPNKLPTCTTPGDSALHCADCEGIIDTKYIPAHHETKQGEPLAVVPASCTRPAYETYKCAVCGNNYDIESGEALGHAFGEPVEVAPTCAKDGYYRSTCTRTGCGEYKDEPSGKTKVAYVPAGFFSLVENDNGSAYANVENWKFQGYLYAIHKGADEETRKTIIKGDCENLGFYQYKCNDCGELIMVAIPDTGNGHKNDNVYDKDGEVAPVEATCNADGTKGTYTCTVCGVTGLSVEPENMNKVPHSLTPVNAANHMKDYCQINYWSCSTCDTEKYSNLFTDAEGKNRVDGFQEHDKELLDSRSVSCENFGYKHYICLHENCRLEYIISYADALGHNWNKTEGKEPTCVEDGVKDRWVCDRTLIDEDGNTYTCGCEDSVNDGSVIPATGIHKNSDGREFTDKCTDTETNRVCVVCKDYIERKHHYADPVYVDATCVDYGYNLYICVDCMDDKMEKVAEKTDHNWGAWTPVEGNPNMEERFCQTERCEAREDRKIADVEYFVEIENVLGNVGYTDSSRIAVTVKIKADSPLWGVRFDLNYDENLTFDGYEFISDKLDCGRDLHDNGGFVRIAADASNTDDKQKTDVVLEGKEALVVVYFRITLPLDPATKLPVVGHEKTESVLSITPIDAINVKDEDLKAVFCGDVVNNAYTDTAKIEILPFMNFNLDCCVNMKDLSEMYDLVLAAEGSDNYDVTLDIDQNGVIEAIDYAYLYRYLVNEKSYEDMTKIGVPADTLA